MPMADCIQVHANPGPGLVAASLDLRTTAYVALRWSPAHTTLSGPVSARLAPQTLAAGIANFWDSQAADSDAIGTQAGPTPLGTGWTLPASRTPQDEALRVSPAPTLP
jgi:hypothetical protein